MKNALVIAAVTVAVLAVMWGGLHVMVRPINPAQKVPKGHFSSACWACHLVNDNAKIVE